MVHFASSFIMKEPEVLAATTTATATSTSTAIPSIIPLLSDKVAAATEGLWPNCFDHLHDVGELNALTICDYIFSLRSEINHIHTLNDFRRPNGTGPIADFFGLVECPCPSIIKFLYEIMTPYDVDLVLDFMAYCLWRSYKFNFWMLFNGAGLNGKSVLLMLIERFFGKDNVSGETLDRLLHERFAAANLFQKMANIDADGSPDVIFNNTGILKKLTGNDLHAGEFKYKKPFAFVIMQN
jgi:hypothetical protein